MKVPPLESWPSGGYTYCCWFRVEDFHDPKLRTSDHSYEPRLLRCPLPLTLITFWCIFTSLLKVTYELYLPLCIIPYTFAAFCQTQGVVWKCFLWPMTYSWRRITRANNLPCPYRSTTRSVSR
jgi:hypothetical protein